VTVFSPSNTHDQTQQHINTSFSLHYDPGSQLFS
jgi:hypothetical protein